MKLKPTIKGLKNQQKETTQKEVATPTQKGTRRKSSNTLPPDVYKPMFEPKRFLVKETRSSKDATKIVKQYMEVSVKRFNDDEAMPHVWLQMYQESDFYTGYLSGKSVYVPLEMLYDLIDNLNEVSDECDKRGIE